MAKPLHESIIDQIKEVDAALGGNSKTFALGVLASLIEKTLIPKNHDAIAAVLVEAAGGEMNGDISKAVAHLESEKARCNELEERKLLKLADKAFENLSKT